jgi:hypothetical protein
MGSEKGEPDGKAKFAPEFKTQVVLYPLSGGKTVAEVCKGSPPSTELHLTTASQRRAYVSRHSTAAALQETVQWYVANEWWWRKIKSGELYREYYQKHYAGREV